MLGLYRRLQRKEDIEKWASDIKAQRRYTDEDRIWQSLLKFIGAKIDDILFHVNGGAKQVEIYKEQVVNEWEAAFVTLRQDCRHDDDAPITLTYGCPVDHKTTRQYAAISEVVTNEDDIKILFDSYFIKLESVNPSGSFKDRGASLLISYLKSIEIEEFVEDSSGNAGLSYSMYAAKGALKANIYVPNYLNENRLFHLKLLNAQIHVIYGSRKDVSDAALVAAQNIFYASHAWNPFFLHGIKTIAYELYEQLNNRILPPIFIPAGNGTLLLGVFLGLRDLLALELIDKIPHLYAIQPANCAPLSYFKEKQTLEGFKPHYSVAEGTLIENPPRLLEMLNAIEESQGDIITVSDETILNAFRILNCKGYFIETYCRTCLCSVYREAIRQCYCYSYRFCS